MEIKYMQKLKANPNIGKRYLIEGLKETQIQKLEAKYNNGNEFPKAFREYLFIGGIKGGTGVVYNNFDDLFEDCEEDMEYCKYSIERPFFIFDNYDGQYSIFFLDEKDEDPKIYILDPFGKKRGEFPLVRPSFLETFSKLINEAIYRIKNDVPF